MTGVASGASHAEPGLVDAPRPIDASTVIVVRDAHASGASADAGASARADAGAHADADERACVEVLMLRRNARGPFGGMWVFPGGRVDPGDRDAAAGAPTDEVGACDPRLADLAASDPRLASSFEHSGAGRGFRAAAVREAREEAGIDLSGAALVHFSHWLPPPMRPKRFSTHFFVCEAPDGIGDVVVDGQEIVDSAWLDPADALARRDAGDMEFVTPTFVTLVRLAAHRTVAGLLRSIASHECFHTLIVPASADDPGHVALYVGDAAFPNGDLAAPGPRRRAWMVASGWRWEEHPASVPPAV